MDNYPIDWNGGEPPEPKVIKVDAWCENGHHIITSAVEYSEDDIELLDEPKCPDCSEPLTLDEVIE